MILTFIQILSAVLLIITILLQTQGSGVSTVFGGGGEFYRSRRSIEKILVWATIVLSVLFCILSLILLLPH